MGNKLIKLRLCFNERIDDKEFDSTPPKIEYSLSNYIVRCVNNHKLESIGLMRDNGWFCDGRSLQGGCMRGITKSFQTLNKNIPRFRCWECNFDLCDKCFIEYKEKKEDEYSENRSKNDNSTERKINKLSF